MYYLTSASASSIMLTNDEKIYKIVLKKRSF